MAERNDDMVVVTTEGSVVTITLSERLAPDEADELVDVLDTTLHDFGYPAWVAIQVEVPAADDDESPFCPACGGAFKDHELRCPE